MFFVDIGEGVSLACQESLKDHLGRHTVALVRLRDGRVGTSGRSGGFRHLRTPAIPRNLFQFLHSCSAVLSGSSEHPPTCDGRLVSRRLRYNARAVGFSGSSHTSAPACRLTIICCLTFWCAPPQFPHLPARRHLLRACAFRVLEGSGPRREDPPPPCSPGAHTHPTLPPLFPRPFCVLSPRSFCTHALPDFPRNKASSLFPLSTRRPRSVCHSSLPCARSHDPTRRAPPPIDPTVPVCRRPPSDSR
eukprot:1177002-Prorocentrum_minimum.AAC.2